MNNIQQVIVYRSPFEQDFYEFMQDYPYAILWFFGFAIVLAAGLKLWDHYNRRGHF